MELTVLPSTPKMDLREPMSRGGGEDGKRREKREMVIEGR